MRKTRGEIKKVGDLFEKYKKTLKAPQGSVIKVFIEVADEVLGISIKKGYVSYSPQSKTISLVSGGPLKSEIYLHKEEILAHMKGRLGEKNAPKTIL